MTVATELAKPAQRFTYILVVEGLAGITEDADSLDIASISGTVFATYDHGATGALASTFGCTVDFGLELPQSLYDSLDPRTMEQSVGGMSFSVVDADGTLQGAVTPKKLTLRSGTQYLGALYEDLSYNATTLRLTYYNPGGSVSLPANGSVVWVGGREAVTLGTLTLDADGTNPDQPPYTYTGCTRAVYGTERGPLLETHHAGATKTFVAGTAVYPHNPYWAYRRVVLLMYQAGGAVSDAVRIYQGRIRGLQRVENGTRWTIDTVAEVFPGEYRSVVQVPYDALVGGAAFIAPILDTGTLDDGNFSTVKIQESGEAFNGVSTNQALHLAYTYRSVPGGRAGAVASSKSAPQAETTTAFGLTAYWVDSVVSIDGVLAHAMQFLATGDTVYFPTPDYQWIVCKVTPELGGTEPVSGTLRFCLDNYTQNVTRNRFTVNGSIRRNVVDVALILLSSYNDEFFIADAIATSATTTTVRFTAPGWTTDQWVGYALHCVEGDNKGESRTITSNNTTTLTVAPAFSSSSHSGNEYQIRNTIYDVLPSGWGMETHNRKLDLEAWENLRDTYFADAYIGRFALTSNDPIDLWGFLFDNIFAPYGIAPYIDRSTGALSVRYVGPVLVDGITETYGAVNDSKILPGSLSSYNFTPRPPVDSITVKTRAEQQVSLYPYGHIGPNGDAVIDGWVTSTHTAPDVLGAEADTTTIRLSQLGQHFPRAVLNALQVQAMLTTRAERDRLITILMERLVSQSNPPPETDLLLDCTFVTSITAGSLLLVSSTLLGARDPYNDTDGLSSVVARVLRSEIVLSGQPHVRCRVALMNAINGAQIAPAARINDITTPLITVDLNTFSQADLATDVDEFSVLDKIGIYDRSGRLKEGPLTINTISGDIIETQEAIASTLETNDYVAFYRWVSGGNTANMSTHAALAGGASETLDGDTPKEWG